MAKNAKKEVVERAPRPRKPGNEVKKANNIQAYQEQFEKLRAFQIRAAELRKEFGFIGGDDDVHKQYDLYLVENEKEIERQKQRDHANSIRERLGFDGTDDEVIAQFVQHNINRAAAVRSQTVQKRLNSPGGKQLVKWLDKRPATYELVEQFVSVHPELDWTPNDEKPEVSITI